MLHTHKKYLATILAFSALALSGSVYADGNNTDISVTVNPSVSLTLSSSSVNMQITPTQSGAYDSNSFTVSASTNNTTGYTLVMTTSSPDLISNTLNFNTNEYPSIPTIAESENGISAADFAASTDSNILNHWGLAIDSGNFNAIKASQTIKTSNTFVTNDTTTLSMASKLDLLTAPGVYSTTLNFQMTANPLPDTLDTAYGKAQKQKTTIGGQDYYAIQDMNSTICADVDVIPSTLQVYDNRDNKIYTIGKLADGRCWMLDDLALDLVSTSLSSLQGKTNASNETLDYLKGNSVRNQQDNPTGNYPTAGVAYWSNTYSYTAPLIAVDKADLSYTNDPIPAASNWKYGVYYNYCAASAGSYCYNYGSNTGNATEDICPAGWRLPTGGDSGEFQVLGNTITNTSETYFDDAELNHMFRKAFHLPMAGWIFSSSTDYNFLGTGAYVWSSSISEGESSMMRILFVDGSYGVGLTNRNNVGFGSAVRCIAK